MSSWRFSSAILVRLLFLCSSSISFLRSFKRCYSFSISLLTFVSYFGTLPKYLFKSDCFSSGFFSYSFTSFLLVLMKSLLDCKFMIGFSSFATNLSFLIVFSHLWFLVSWTCLIVFSKVPFLTYSLGSAWFWPEGFPKVDLWPLLTILKSGLPPLLETPKYLWAGLKVARVKDTSKVLNSQGKHRKRHTRHVSLKHSG